MPGFCCDGLGAEIAGTDFEVSEGFSSLSLSLSASHICRYRNNEQ